MRSGAKWETVVPRASELGLAALHGSTPDVSVAGYSLGGGIGWYARKHGLAANSVTAIELVTADGELRRVDLDNEPELFWALRGGGGNFGVVTAIEFELYPIREVYAGVLFFPFERASEVLHAWHEWTGRAPEEVTSVGRMLQFPPIPEVPEPLRGQTFAVVEAVFLGSEADGRALLEPLRDLGPGDGHLRDGPAGRPRRAAHGSARARRRTRAAPCCSGDLSAGAIDAFLSVAGPGSGSPLVSVELRHLGGALGAHGAAPRRGLHDARARSRSSRSAWPPLHEIKAAVETYAEVVADTMRPYESGHYSNFTEESGSAGRFFCGEVWDRLRAVKAQYDPEQPLPREPSDPAGLTRPARSAPPGAVEA